MAIDPSVHPVAPHVAGAPSKARPEGWARLQGAARVVPLVAVLLVGVTVAVRLPPGVCFGDGGDLQLASVTLGIMHPPGYAGLAALGWIVTRLPGVDPAYLVSLACVASGLVALWIGVRFQIRLGVSPWIASAVVLALSAHPRVLANLSAPEVYAPSLALLSGAAYMSLRAARTGSRRDATRAALLFGFALANRPSTALMLPFFAAAWWLGRGERNRGWQPGLVRAGWMASGLVVPVLFSLAYLWVRDRPDVPYNYIEQHNAGERALPDTTVGPGAKLDRVIWQATGREFRSLMGTTAWQARIKWLWLRHELMPPDRQGTLAILVAMGLLGAVFVYRRCTASFLILTGLLVGSLVFVFLYQVFGLAADLLPLLFAAGVCLGVAVSVVLPREGGGWAHRVEVGLFAVGAVAVVADVSRRPPLRAEVDATEFLRELDPATLPAGAVVVADWKHATALWYAREVLVDRPDIDIINTDAGRWVERIRAMPARPVLAAMPERRVVGYRMTPYRNVMRLVRSP